MAPHSDPNHDHPHAADPVPAHGHCGTDHHHGDHEHSDHGHGHHGAVTHLPVTHFPWARLASCFLLLLWGGIMVYYFASGRVVHYLTGFGGFRLQALICGLLLCVLAAFELLVRPAPDRSSHDHSHSHDPETCGGCHDDDHDHDHASPSSWISKLLTFLILALPLSAAALYSPDRYSDQFFINKANSVTSAGSTALGGGGIDLSKRAEKSRALTGSTPGTGTGTSTDFTVEELERLSGGRTPEGNIPLQLVELFYMPAQTRDVQQVVSTQTVETTGQAIKDKQDPTKMRLFRLMMTCCAADARPISIPVEFTAAPPEWREMGWYKVTGSIEYREINGSQTTVFKAGSVTPSKPPRQQMMY